MNQAAATVEAFRMSPQQRRLWKVAQGEAAFSASCVLVAEGPLSPGQVEGALRETFARHEILRTGLHFPPGLGIPAQVIAPGCVAPLAVQDLRSLPAELRKRRLEQCIADARAAGCDAERPPLVRVVLVRLEGERHALVLVLSSLVADSWSLDNFVAELCRSCGGEALVDGEPIQYADFSEWQNGFESPEGEEGRAYWRAKGLRLPLTPALPLAPATDRFLPAQISWSLDEASTVRLETLAAARGADLQDVLLAGWAVVLWHCSPAAELVIGYLAHGRRHEPLRGALGLMARYLPLVCTLSAETRFWDLVALVRSTVAEDLAWQELFTWEALQAEGSERLSFPVTFAMEELQSFHPAGPLRFTVQAKESCIDRFGVEHRGTRRRGEGLQLAVRYDSGRFAPSSAGALAARLSALLDRVGAEADEPVGALRGPSEAAAHFAAIERNDTGRPLPATTLQHRLADQVAKRPEAVAVIEGDTRVTYAELGRRVGAVARSLTRWGLRPGDLVGLCAERSVDAVAGLLGILTAGGAFLYLDPELPDARLALLTGDASPCLVLAGQRLLPRLERIGLRCGLLPLDLQGLPEEPLEVAASDPDLLAYVVYTSGSTGAPKGVLTPQRGVLGYLDFVADTYGLRPSDVVLQLAPLSFDASVRDLIGPLLRGAAVVLLGPEQARDPREMVLAVRRHGVSHLLSVVPTLLRALVAAAEGEEGAGSLRSILTSGERLFGEDCRRARRAFGEALQIVNQYGPTECTMTSSWRAVPAAAHWDAVPLGWPAWNVRLHLLDEHLDPVPEGWPGELYIAGEGVGWGYVGQPGLTAARFLPEVRAASPGSRMYRTGDLVRRLPDGDLELLGRLDDQLKIRGVRVEPGEVEAVLGRHPEVRQAVVVGRGERLVAYVVPRQEGGPRPADVMAYLRDHLPEPLVPADLVLLSRFPLTRTGKVDRRALPAPETLRPEAEPAAPGSLSPLEEMVAQIWAQLLGRPRIGPDESFFSLGGHSLLATQAMARLRDALGVQIPLQAAFEAPTVAAMAKRIQQALDGGVPLPPLRPASRSGPLPLSFSQERHWFLHAREPESALLNNAGGLRFRGRLDVRALAASLRELVRRHEVLRTGFPAVNGQPMQVIAPEVEPGLPVVDLDGLPDGARESAASRLVSTHALRSFDLAKPPLLRLLLLRLKTDEHVAAVALHHIVSDLWSVGVFVRELTALYDAFSAGRPSSLPEPELQYADFAVWQREWLQGEVMDRLLAYWKGELPSGGRAPQLFPDRATEGKEPAGRRYPLTVPAPLAAGLRDLGRAEGATLFMVLLAGFQALLCHLTGVDDVVVGAPIANRKLTETEGMIGCFINALALRTVLRDDASFRQVLRRVRKTVLGAYTHQDLPFERLVEQLNPNRALSRWPLFQVTFNFQNEPIAIPPLPELTIESFDIEGGMPVKYDLGLYLTDSGGELSGALGYSPALFEASTVAGFGESLLELLALCGERPDITVGEIREALSASERHRRAASQELLRESRRRSLGQARRRTVQG